MKKLISFAVAGMFALSLAACGSSSAAASITESSAESTAASTADSAAADSDLAYLQNKGKMTIGYTVYEPMNYTDESGTFTGLIPNWQQLCVKSLAWSRIMSRSTGIPKRPSWLPRALTASGTA